MRISPGKMVEVSETSSGIVCSFSNSEIEVSFLTRKIISVEYRINGVETPEELIKSSSYLVQDPKLPPVESQKEETQEETRLKADDISVAVSKANGNISVFKGSKLLHGGELGDSDTVLPNYQFRLLGEKDVSHGRFCFPLEKDDRFFGLGDKGGSPDRRGRRFMMFNRDSLGYDAEYSDPLYKSIPFFIKDNRKENTIVGFFFPETAIESVDFGRESAFIYSIDILKGPFKYFVILGDDYKDIINNYCLISGFPAFPPLFSFGYLGSSMNYVEAWDAQKRILKFFEDTEKYRLPCEGLYVSSGYLKADDGKRYSFFWNKRKFPDPKAFIGALQKRGYHLTFNIKPGILTTHPWYQELREKKFFLSDESPIVEFFWGGDASFIDFENPEAVKWWKAKLKENYLDYGAEGIWNDNNECELEDQSWKAFSTRAIYPVRMAEASYQVCLELNPGKRPWIYSRSGYSGIQRYARTWTGDNSSTFKTLKFNQYQGLSLGVSAVPFVGHDLGGFFGEEPSAELLVRSCQSAIFQPRFVIHSWRENDEPTEPWKDPEAFKMIKEALEEHYVHMPFIYNAAYRASRTGVPMDRILTLEYPNDENLRTDLNESLFGGSVLKTLVTEENASTLEVIFPKGDDWYCPFDGKLYKGGIGKTFDLPLERFLYFYKVGSVIPTTANVDKLRTGFFENLVFRINPASGSFDYEFFEDDGQSVLSPENHNLWKLEVSYDLDTKEGSIKIENRVLSKASPKRTFTIKLPEGFSECAAVDFDEINPVMVINFSGEYTE